MLSRDEYAELRQLRQYVEAPLIDRPGETEAWNARRDMLAEKLIMYWPKIEHTLGELIEGHDPDDLIHRAVKELADRAMNDGWIGMLSDEQLAKLRNIVAIETSMRGEGDADA